MSADALTADFKTYQDRVTSSLVNVTRNAAAVASEDLSFHRNLSDRVSSSLDAQNAYFLRLTNKLLKAVVRDTNVKAPTLQSRDDVDDKWRRVVDVVDDLLEKADANLDEYNGGITRMTPQSSTPEPSSNLIRPTNTNYQNYSNTLTKPQLLFDRKVDNFESGPWLPLLTSKPHALISLDESLKLEGHAYHHPYVHEIAEYEFPGSVYRQAAPKAYIPPEASEPIWVDTEEGVDEMLEHLKLADEIAVDLEHNDRNSYIGLVSLMQISTRNQDWLVDTLVPWREKLQKLNQVFANPAILKVFHGSASDMIWLQRDLGIYVVGLFDTFWAASALHYQSKSLAFLLDKFCNFKAQKQYQLADWRVRPLPEALVEYARSDTHYLLFIYDNMRNELVQASTSEKDLVKEVLENSKQEALQIYERRPYDRINGLGSEGWLKMLAKLPGVLDKEQFGILKELHAWRDQKAREIDEGPSSIMTNKFLLGCVQRPPKKTLHLFNNHDLGKASHFVAKNPIEVLEAIDRGRKEGPDGASMQEVIERNADQITKLRRFYNPKPAAKKSPPQATATDNLQAQPNNSVASVNMTASPSEPSIGRTASSLLWGATTLSSPITRIDAGTAQTALKMIMPTHSTSTDQMNETASTSRPAQVADADILEISANGEVRIVEEPNIDVAFTLRKSQNQKRTADEIEGGVDLLSAYTANGDKYAVTDEGKVSRYSDKRRAFKRGEDTNEQVEQTEFKPFDYANAQSMLHASNNIGATQVFKDGNSTKPFNPYVKALDTTTGAKRNRMGKELAGKSHTFKS